VFTTNLPTSRSNVPIENTIYIDFLKRQLNLNLNPDLDLNLLKRSSDELGTQHVKLNLTFKGLPVTDAEYGFHHYPNGEVFIHGNLLVPQDTPDLQSGTNLNVEEIVTNYFTSLGIPCQLNQSAGPLKSGIKSKQNAYWQNTENDRWYLVSNINVTPNLRQNWDLVIDPNYRGGIKSKNPMYVIWYITTRKIYFQGHWVVNLPAARTFLTLPVILMCGRKGVLITWWMLPEECLFLINLKCRMNRLVGF
jgi:Zn-dependent metalloprotease